VLKVTAAQTLQLSDFLTAKIAWKGEEDGGQGEGGTSSILPCLPIRLPNEMEQTIATVWQKAFGVDKLALMTTSLTSVATPDDHCCAWGIASEAQHHVSDYKGVSIFDRQFPGSLSEPKAGRAFLRTSPQSSTATKRGE